VLLAGARRRLFPPGVVAPRYGDEDAGDRHRSLVGQGRADGAARSGGVRVGGVVPVGVPGRDDGELTMQLVDQHDGEPVRGLADGGDELGGLDA
jgi:hypothetical protein